MYKRFILALGMFLGSPRAGGRTNTRATYPSSARASCADHDDARCTERYRHLCRPLPSCCPRTPENPLPISVSCSQEPTNVTTAWSAFRRWKKSRLCFSRSRACRSSNSGADGCNWTPFRARFTCRTRAAWSFRLWWYAGLSSPATKLCGRPAFGPSLRPQPELSLWRRRPDRTRYGGVSRGLLALL
jgi:hypothetical protein